MYIPFLPALKNPKDKKTELGQDLPTFSDEMMYFESGRQAMRAGIGAFDFKENDIILMPASLCSAVIEPFADLGIRLKLYGLNEKFRWDINEIKSSITPSTKAIYVIQYFGITEDLAELKLLCRAHEIVLIEDRALCGFDPDQKEKEYGDLVIYSIWKFHPIGEGAILKINGRPLPRNIRTETRPRFTRAKREIKVFLKYVLVRLGIPIKTFQKIGSPLEIPSNESLDKNFAEEFRFFSITKKSQRVFLREDLKACKLRRLRNFNSLYEFCLRNSISTLYGKVTDDSVPYCFPVIVNSADTLQASMRKDGIETEVSINPPCEIDSLVVRSEKKFDEISDLADRVLSIPIHQDIDDVRLTLIKASLMRNLSPQLSEG